jgi:hypothetical protein
MVGLQQDEVTTPVGGLALGSDLTGPVRSSGIRDEYALKDLM